MPRFFKRKYELTISVPGQPGIKWDKLNIRFKIEKTRDSGVNESNITLFNASKTSRDFIDKAGLAVNLEGGYEEESGVLFLGKIDPDSVTHVKSDTDWLSEITSKSGATEYRNTLLSRNFGPNSSKKDVINGVIDELGLEKGVIKGVPNTIFKHGKALYGSAKQQLDILTKSDNLEAFITDEKINIVPIGQAINDLPVLLSADSGLIGTPEKTDKGFKLTSFLRAVYNPGMLIEVKSIAANGIFIIRNVSHIGEFEGNDWFSILEVETRK